MMGKRHGQALQASPNPNPNPNPDHRHHSGGLRLIKHRHREEYITAMRRTFYPAALPVGAVVLIVVALVLSLTSNPGNIATAAIYNIGVNNPDVPAAWINPINVSNSTLYDNNSSVGAAPANGAVTIGWEQRQEPGYSYNNIIEASNTVLGGPFNLDVLHRTGYKESGNVVVRHDSLGRRHIVWWEQSGNTVCDYYARIEANGVRSILEPVPGTCGPSPSLKGTALAIGPDNTVHALFGRDNSAIYYFQRTDTGWVVQNELVTASNAPTSLTLAVSTQGTVMAAWMGYAPTLYYDIYTGTRTAPGQWLIEDVSYNCCSGCPAESRTYIPTLASDPNGGFRLAWADEQCDPRTNPRTTDLYYREWVPGTGWNNQPLVRVVVDSGEVYNHAIAVDDSGVAHILFDDDTDRAFHDYIIRYVSGSGTTFSPPTLPFNSWAHGAYQKVPSLDYAGGYLHATFNSDRDDPRKEVYYSYNMVGPPPSRCPGERYRDVCPGDTFYTYIMNLTNLGVISGYSDGTFRPDNPLTRGQTTKILKLAANLPDVQPPQPSFADVPTTHPFYSYVEAAYAAGIMTGYACGGPGEPCDPQNRPYFRPDNMVTRGQLSKMTALAFGFNEPVSGQTFSDVPPSNPFYVYIERMARRGIIGGYSDGTFRPNNPVTRGQACKIVDNSRLQPTPTPTPVATSTPTSTSTPIATPTDTPVPTTTPTPQTPTVTPTSLTGQS